jgi:hypothetical protein
MFLPVPPLVVRAPTPFPLGVQIAPPVFSLAAMFAIIVDRSVQSRFRLFNGVLAVRAVVGMRSRRSGEKQKRSHHQSCRCVVSKSSNHVNLLSDFVKPLDFMDSCRPISIQFFRYAIGVNASATPPIRISDRLALPRYRRIP